MGINRSIPGMYQGVSQQPPAMRAPEQCERMENAYPSVADGVDKRPPSQYVSLLFNGTPSNAFIHQYDRGNGEEYVVGIWQDGSLHVWDRKTGAVKTVTVDASANPAYITTPNPMDDIGMLTIADTTFIWNRTVQTAFKPATLTAPVPTLFVYIKTAQPDTAYTVDLPGFGTASVQRSAGSANTVQIALDLATAINAFAGAPFVVTQTGNLLAIRRSNNADFPFNVFDQAGGSLLYGFKNRVERYSDLPRTATDGTVVKVQGQGDTAGSKNAYWVKYRNLGTLEAGYWEETVAPVPGEFTDFDPSVWPHQLVRQADGTFLLKSITWSSRLVGSLSAGSIATPSVIGQRISEMFFYRNRLGLLSEENILMSRSNDFFNFWPKSAAAVNDDDPIDVTANTTRVCQLRHAVPFQRQLMLFSDNTQFPLTGGEILSPKNVRVDSATEFDCSALVRPVSSGQDLFFVFERASSTGATRHSGVREYFVNQSAVTNDATDVSAHIPQYVPGNVYRASVSSTEDILLLLSKDEWNRVYFYKYLWDNDKRIQSCWGRWTFRPHDKVISAVIGRTTVNLVIQREDGVHLERMELQSTATTDTLPFQVRLDSLAQATYFGYDSGNNWTSFQLPYALTSDIAGGLGPAGSSLATVPTFIAGPGTTSAGSIIPVMDTAGSGSGTLYFLKGDWRGRAIYAGVPYEHHHTFSQLFMRDRDGNAIHEGRLQLKYFTVNFRNAVSFRADVESIGRDTATYRYTSFKLGFADALLGSPVLRSGSWTFPLASRSTNCQFTVVNDSPYPCAFYSGEWEGEFNTRSQRV